MEGSVRQGVVEGSACETGYCGGREYREFVFL